MNFWEACNRSDVGLAYKPTEYTFVLRNYLNKYFIKKFKENKNFEFHYKNILGRCRNAKGFVRESGIFSNDSILLSTKRMNYDDCIISNIDDRDILTTSEWLDTHGNVILGDDGKLKNYRLIVIISRTSPLSETGDKFLTESPLFENLTNEFNKVHRYYFDEIMYIMGYEFLKIKNHVETLKEDNTFFEWDRFLDILLKTMDDGYLLKLKKLKEDIIQIDDPDYQTLKDEILISDVYKEREELYRRCLTLSDTINLRDMGTERTKQFLRNLKQEDKKPLKKVGALMNQMRRRNRYILSKTVGLINEYNYGDM